MALRITTREFVLADYDRVVTLWNAVEGVEVCEGDTREEIGEYLKWNPGISRVAETNGTIVGAALCGHDGRRGWIYHLAVAPEHRGQGVARLLVDECVAGLRAAGIKRAIIRVLGAQRLGRYRRRPADGARPLRRGSSRPADYAATSA